MTAPPGEPQTRLVSSAPSSYAPTPNAALGIATVLGLIVCFATRPRDTLLFMGVLVVTGLASARPALFIGTLGVIGLVVIGAGIKRKRRHPLLLTPPRESD